VVANRVLGTGILVLEILLTVISLAAFLVHIIVISLASFLEHIIVISKLSDVVLSATTRRFLRLQFST